MTRLLIPLAALILTACAQTPAATTSQIRNPTQTTDAAARLADVLTAQPEETQARYAYRHPQETMAFFGIAPGMTVVEALPGGGWYSKLLVDYLGSDGHLVGVDYEFSMWPRFGFFSAEAIEAKKTWVSDWTAEAQEWRTDDSAQITAFVFGSMPRSMTGKADAVLFIRAMHNLNRFEKDGAYMTTAIDDAWRALRPGGVAGIVQHQARDAMSDAFADGSNGYLKKNQVIASMEKAGFVYEGSIDVNANPKDRPTEDDIVWRLQPTFFTSRDDEALKAQLAKIGESNRMTLKFRKPAN